MKSTAPAIASVLPMDTLPLRASLSAAFLCMLFGGNATAIKFSLAGLGSFTTAGLRFSIAALTLLSWAVLTGKPLALNRRQLMQMLRLSAIFIFQLSFFYVGLEHTTASHGTLIANLLPFIVLILAHLFVPGDFITLRKMVGIGFGFLGVLFLLFDPGAIGAAVYRGDLFVLAAVCLWGCNAIYVKRIIPGFHPVQVTVYPMLFTIPLFFLCGWLWDTPMVTEITPGVVGGLLYQGLVTASFGFVAWNTLLRQFGASAVHSFIFITPISGVLSGVVLLGEPLTPQLLFSIFFIVTGVMIVHLHRPGKKGMLPRPPGVISP